MAQCLYPAVLAILTGLLSCSPVLTKYDNYPPSAYKMQLGYGLPENAFCRTMHGLTRPQIKVCEREPDTAKVALQGLARAAKECQYQFHDHRWNCSALTPPKNLYTSAIFQKGFKETAFVYALSSASMVISVARACASSDLTNCNCDKRKYSKFGGGIKEKASNDSFKWGGCSHNLNYGVSFTKKFLDTRENPNDIYATINLNNNRVGIKAVKNNMQLRCKCHGLSGSCQMKTCWRVVPDLRLVAEALVSKYQKAIMFDPPNRSNANPKKLLKKIIKKKRKEKLRLMSKEWDPKSTKVKIKGLDLVYYETSPSFCDKDQSLGILGTSGRFCNNSNHNRPDSCSSLCCGRGHNMIFNKQVYNCNCKFIWCCKVECETCEKSEWVSVCK